VPTPETNVPEMDVYRDRQRVMLVSSVHEIREAEEGAIGCLEVMAGATRGLRSKPLGLGQPPQRTIAGPPVAS